MVANRKFIAKRPNRKTLKSISKKEMPDAMTAPPLRQIAFLQQTLGNRAVQRLYESGAIQAKLTIGRPNDIYEEEADRVADAVMRTAQHTGREQTGKEEDALIRTKALADGTSPHLQREAGEGGEHAGPIAQALESRIEMLRGGGMPLPGSEREFFESRFGRDFSGVRIHRDAEANRLAGVLNARAFTKGNHIVFGPGRYAPGTASGRRLLAHELTHVAQQHRENIGRIMRTPGLLGSLFGWVKKAVKWVKKGVKAVVGFVVDAIKKMSPWSLKWVLFLLCDTSLGRSTIGLLQTHPVYRFVSHTLKRQYFADPSMTIKKGGVQILRALGYFDPNTRTISIKAGLSNGHAASTLVHESTHARQWGNYVANKRKFDLAKWEYEAHIREEHYKISKGIAPKHPSFRMRRIVNGAWVWVVNKPGIIQWVNKKYGIKQYFRDWDETVTGKTGPIGPWQCS